VSSISSILSRPNCHWFTGTPDPKHSVFKPFIFCPDIQLTQSIASPSFNPDPAKVKPRFQSKVDRRHPLYKRHETFYPKVTSSNEEGLRLRETLAELENNCVDEVEQLLDNYKQDDNKDLLDLFNDAVEAELRFYK
jgi:secernin